MKSHKHLFYSLSNYYSAKHLQINQTKTKNIRLNCLIILGTRLESVSSQSRKYRTSALLHNAAIIINLEIIININTTLTIIEKLCIYQLLPNPTNQVLRYKLPFEFK